MSGWFAPAAAAAPRWRILGRYTALELRLTLRRGQSFGLTLAVPVLAIAGVGLTDVVNLPTGDRLGYVVPGAIALSVLSQALVGLAIGTGYERTYGALVRLGASPLGRPGLIAGKTAAVLVAVVAQAAVLAGFGAALGWRPAPGGLPAALAATVLAVVAFAGLGLLLAARLRPETVTGAATLLLVVLLAVSGVVFPGPDLGPAEAVNPLAGYADILREALSGGATAGAGAAGPGAWAGLAGWAALGAVAAARWFRWD